MKKVKLFTPIILFIFYTNCLFAQVMRTDANRPKVGLVLSGGAAKGFAHIGLLKVLEEAGIRPDYITGASMGSIVGGLYALGLNAKELEQIALSQNWELVLSNKVDLESINILEKKNFDSHLLSLHYQDGKFLFPQGLIDGQYLSLVLARLACSGHFIDNFDDFPIPFRCVAVNLIDGEVVVLDKGFLARAQRASMAIPSVFTPVELDDKLLVDGGVIRNLPAQEVIDMGADIVIGAYAGAAAANKDDMKTGIDILVQTSFLYSIADTKEQALLCDIYVNLAEHYDAADFDKAQEIIDAGEREARIHLPAFKALAKKINQFPIPLRKAALTYPDSLYIKEINTTAIDKDLEQLVRRSLNIKVHQKQDLRAIEQGINYAFGTQFFTNVNYALSSDSIGTTVHIEAENVAPAIMNFGLHYSNAEDAAIILKANLRNVIGKASIMSGGLRISQSPALTANYKHYIGYNRRFLYKLGMTFQKFNQNTFIQNGDLIRPYNRRQLEGFGQFLWMPKHNFLFGLGYKWNSYELEPKSEEPLNFEKFSTTNKAIELFYKWNTLDKNYFPSKGMEVYIGTSWHHGLTYKTEYNTPEAIDFVNIATPDKYTRAHLFLSNYTSLNPSIVLFQHFGVGISTEPVLFDNFQLGGDFFNRQQSLPFVGLREYETPFSNVANLQLGLRYALNPKFFLALKGNIAAGNYAYDAIFDDFKDNTLVGGGLSIEYDSFLGPISFTLGKNSWNKEWQYAINMGHRFNF